MEGQEDRPVASNRSLELIVAALFLIFGAIVVWDSRRLGSQWGSDGPQAGYFPFYIGVIICIASVVNIFNAINSGARGSQPFVLRGQLKMVLAIMVPTVIYVALIANPVYSLGIYEASIVFIAFFMRWLGRYPWGKTLAVSVLTVVAFFVMFEIWFKVPLPKGPLESLLGFN
jgi:putative tricarboxylic transport membrane protein